MSRRAAIATGVVALWLGGMVALARRELFSDETERLARAALYVAPGAEYYEISDGTRQIGFGSSTIDTTGTAITISDLVVADLPDSGRSRRLAARGSVELTRALRLRRFRYQVGGDVERYLASGTVQGDTLLTLLVRTGSRPARTERVRLDAPLLLPTMVPMAIALGEQPKVGSRYTYRIFDPFTSTTRRATVRVQAESLFVLPDSAILDPTGTTWVVAHLDTVRAWRIVEEHGGRLTGWVDGRGRMVQAAPLDRFFMRRTAYELAFENWSHDRAGGSESASRLPHSSGSPRSVPRTAPPLQ